MERQKNNDETYWNDQSPHQYIIPYLLIYFYADVYRLACFLLFVISQGIKILISPLSFRKIIFKRRSEEIK